MSQTPCENQAAWNDAKGSAVRIGKAEDWSVAPDEVKIRNRAVALNPADPLQLDLGMFIKQWPWIFGYDLAGEIVQVGDQVKDYTVGQKVLALTPGAVGNLEVKAGAFQLYTVLSTRFVAKIPDSWAFTDAAVFPVAVATAAAALFHKNNLALSYPTVPASPANGKILLIWSGASSVGVTALQMAVQAGYECITTSSSKHLKSLGATHTFDYSSSSVINDIAAVIKGREKDYVGAFSAAQDRAQPIQAALVAGLLSVQNSPVATSNPRFNPDDVPANARVSAIVSTQVFANVIYPGFENEPEISKRIFEWLYKAMEAGTIKAAPKPLIVGKGLEAVQEAVDRMRKGVSGQKLVVEL